MATLYVRNVPAELYAELRRWAEAAGRSVNAEVLALLEREVAQRRSGSGWVDSLVEWSEELGLTREDADLAIQAIREHRDAGSGL
ncbi:MAG: FitA-like ribbon-helix-helix domain-containing protein [Solirubrobacteraceae bacterium]